MSLTECRSAGWRLAALATLALTAPGCGSKSPAPPAPSPGPAETAWQELRYWDDQLRLTESLASDTTPDGLGLALVRDSLARARERFAPLLQAGMGPAAGDREAQAVMQAEWDNGLHSTATPAAPESSEASCSYRPESVGIGLGALDRLTARVLACYGRAAESIVVDGDTLDRLAILGLLPRTADPARRRRLFLALGPVWAAINGDHGPGSPYRTMLRLRRSGWNGGGLPVAEVAADFGLTAAEVETWLTAALARWRATMPDTTLEPWDWYYLAGAASRKLSPRIPAVADLRRVNDAFYRDLGAAPERLGIHYDLAPRPGKYPVAFTDFGSRNRWRNGAFLPGAPWVFASYREGGFDNLAELLHETGHAIHIAALRTRPAYLDWPASDTFTEALADFPALELYEPVWQQHYLGDSVPLAESLRAKYAGIVFDMAWALFEIRVHRVPDADPDTVWTAIADEYLRIRPHPEWSWWAMRGQLIDSPGYLLNYALGAFIAADLRHRVALLRGGFSRPDSSLYPWISERIYRFGRERPARRVLEEFLGRPLDSRPLLDDLDRVGARP